MVDRNKEIIQQVWEGVRKEGYTALKKEHVSIIMEHGTPKDMAALIVNGYSEPIKYGKPVLVTEKKASKIAEKYSKYKEYCDALALGDILDNFEKEMEEVRFRYEYDYSTAVFFLKEYIDKENLANLLSNIVECSDDKSVKKIKNYISEYNATLMSTRRTLDKFDCNTGLKFYNGKVVIKNLSKIKKLWESGCSRIRPHGITYKTYLFALQRWISEHDIMICTPTSIIKQINDIESSLTWDSVPEEYRASYKRTAGRPLSDEENLLASFPDCLSLPCNQTIEENLYNSLEGKYKNFKI